MANLRYFYIILRILHPSLSNEIVWDYFICLNFSFHGPNYQSHHNSTKIYSFFSFSWQYLNLNSMRTRMFLVHRLILFVWSQIWWILILNLSLQKKKLKFFQNFNVLVLSQNALNLSQYRKFDSLFVFQISKISYFFSSGLFLLGLWKQFRPGNIIPQITSIFVRNLGNELNSFRSQM